VRAAAFSISEACQQKDRRSFFLNNFDYAEACLVGILHHKQFPMGTYPPDRISLSLRAAESTHLMQKCNMPMAGISRSGGSSFRRIKSRTHSCAVVAPWNSRTREHQSPRGNDHLQLSYAVSARDATRWLIQTISITGSRGLPPRRPCSAPQYPESLPHGRAGSPAHKQKSPQLSTSRRTLVSFADQSGASTWAKPQRQSEQRQPDQPGRQHGRNPRWTSAAQKKRWPAISRHREVHSNCCRSDSSSPT